MKLQHLAIIFVIIMLPISMVISSYIQTQIDTISLQTKYSTKLQTATYDAIRAFQLNTLNNKYSTVSDSKIRDIEASISTFYNSLGTELGASGYNTESLEQFIPAIVYTMYDGYYIYGRYFNYNKNEYQYGLKPYIYYSCRYVKGNSYDFVVNYTLDNNITVYGKIKENYITKSGTLINPELVTNITKNVNGDIISLVYDGITIEPEVLKEQLIILDDNNNPSRDYYEYVMHSNKKVYYNGDGQYFWHNNNKKQYITDKETLEFVTKWTYNGHLHSNSAIEYYAKAKDFSDWVNDNLSGISQENAVDSDGNTISDFAINTANEPIFKLSKNNNPLLESSTFNQNRISVIRKIIQTTLNTAIANYSSSADYEFAMPIFTEEDWDKLVNNITVASFMQGIPIGSKYFNNYCIITNNKNKEIVTKDSIYIITNDNNTGTETDCFNEVHRASSIDVIDNKKQVIAAYRNVNFEMQTVTESEPDTHYYPHANNRCYECMVNVSQEYSIDDIIEGSIKVYDKNTDTYIEDKTKDITNLRKIYLTALARERYDLYKTNSYFGT